MRGVGWLAAATFLAGCASSTAPAADFSAYKSQYLDVHKDESSDRIVVDDVRMTREWSYIQLKASKATLHAAVNTAASKSMHHAMLHRADTFVVLGEPSANIKDGDYVSFCGMSGSGGAAVSSVSITIGDSGSNEELVTATLTNVAACR